MVNRNCLKCNKEFKTYPSEVKVGKAIYCSKPCYYSSKVGGAVSKSTKLRISKTLKKIGHLPPSNFGKKHSEEHKKKIGKANSGEKSNLWKGGRSSLQQILRQCFQYRQWRNDIYKRDDYTCQWCLIKGGKLNADHIKPFSVILNEYNITTYEEAIDCVELWDTNNGRTLCVECHYKTDTFAGNSKKKSHGNKK